VSELKDAGKPVDIVVIGDSTSANARTNWVYLLGEWIGREYDRPVTITPWSPDARPPQYVNDVRPHRGGSGAPVHIWASGASGKGVEYAVANLDELLPQPARDAAWVIVNHGHNALPDTLSGQVLDLLDGIEARAPSAVKTVILQNPERPGSANDAGSTSNVRVLADSVSYNGYGTIDVMSAFTSREDYAPLLDGAIHPNAQGYRLWARTVEAALTKAG
jgi:lysophospholipase L1-like esterase